MAKLLSYYRLCPLIDTKNLLGITEDDEKGVDIVTLGRNIAIKYRLSDQKQLCSWRSKDKFSSPVCFDKIFGKYVAVFNQMFIKMWTEEDETPDHVKKYKFSEQIYTLITHNGQAFVIFKTGSVYPLSEILSIRKTFASAKIIEETEIFNVCYTSLDDDLYLGLLVKVDNMPYFYWTVYSNYSKNVFSKNKLVHDNAVLKGYELFTTNKTVNFLTIWSDGKICAKELFHQEKKWINAGEIFMVLETISTEHSVKLLALDDKHIAIYGSDPNEEGAVLFIYNTQFNVIQSRQIHKLYTEEAKLWKTFNYILLPVGQNLVVVPFSLKSELLVALIGSHKPIQSKIDADIAITTEYELGDWGQGNQTTEVSSKKIKKNIEVKIKKNKDPSKILENMIEGLLKEGLPEGMIAEQIIPEILESNNINLLIESLNYFTDISENVLAEILKFALTCHDTHFQNTALTYINLPDKLSSGQRIILLDRILTRRFSSNILLPYLRTILTIDEATLLLEYLIYQMSEDGHDLPPLNAAKTEERIVKWISLVVDSNYQRFILSKDTNIQNVLVKCQNVVSECLNLLDGLKTLVPVLSKVGREEGVLANKLYNIEVIHF